VAVSSKYGKVNISKIGENEPVFILRAQDELAESAIRMYQSLAASHESKIAKSLDKEIDTFHKWQGVKKLPD
jgi:hypothetical protein